MDARPEKKPERVLRVFYQELGSGLAAQHFPARGRKLGEATMSGSI
jgi:hypothetical protein